MVVLAIPSNRNAELMTEQIAFIPLDEAVKLADCPGLTADLIKQLALRHKVLAWGEKPGRGMVIDQQDLEEIASTLREARAEGVGQYISAYDVEHRYGIHRSTWGRWRERGYIRNENDLLCLEDVCFVAKLAECTGYTRGRPLFPNSYKPY